MMVQCDWCGKENDGKVEIVIATVGRFRTCGDCLDKYVNHEYDKIPLKVKLSEEIDR